MKQVAVFGGTFDPPTRAHEGIVAACLERPDIDEIWWMPSGQRRDKPGMLSDAGRLAMLQLIKATTFHNDDRLIITDFEQRLPQPSRTYQTDAALRQTFPDHQFLYVFGADIYDTMPSWHHGEELRQRLGMLLVKRAGLELPPESDRIRHLGAEYVDPYLSSSRLRQATALGESIADHVSPAVAQYIADRALYAEVVR